MAIDRLHTFLTARTTSLDISFHVATASAKRGLRSWKAMNPRTTRVDHHPGAKDELCAPRMFTHGHTRQLAAVLRRHLVALAGRTPVLAGIGERALLDIDSLLLPVSGDVQH